MPAKEIQHEDGIRSWIQNGIPVLELTHRADPEKREEYDTGERRLVTRDVYDLIVKELRNVHHLDPETRKLVPANTGALVDALTAKVLVENPDGSREYRYEITTNWFSRTREGMSQEFFDQEFRCKLGLSGFRRVYQDFTVEKHLVDDDSIPFDPTKPLLRGWDPSNEWTAVCFCQIDPNGRLVVYKTLTDERGHPSDFAVRVQMMTKSWFPTVQSIYDYGDVGYGRSKNSSDSYYTILQRHGIMVRGNTRYGVMPEDRIMHVRFLLCNHSNDKPLLLVVNNIENRGLIEAFLAEYRYKADGETVDKKRRPHADIMNALEYVVVNGTQAPSFQLDIRKRGGLNHGTTLMQPRGSKAIREARKTLGLRLKYDTNHRYQTASERRIVKRW